MARRPRPASRRPPQRQGKPSQPEQSTRPAKSTFKTAKPNPVVPESDEDSHSEEEVSGKDESASDSGESLAEEEDVDIDAPRVAQWVDEEELEWETDEEDGSEAEEAVAGPSNLKTLQNDLSALPLGALRKAQKALATAKAEIDSDEDEEASEDELSEAEDSNREDKHPRLNDSGKGKAQERTKPEIEKRKNKHAPIEMSSRRRERRKLIIEDKRLPARDPRFLPMTGEFSADRFRTQYGFLSNMHQDELKTLRENLKRARRMLASSPRDQREERVAEVSRLENAVKRAESSVNKDRRDQIEQTTMQKVRHEEREKQKQGKGAWFMKDADKKDMLMRARYDALAESGGKRAVKKAIEKKQKKISQKEKKKRPFAPGETGKRRSIVQGDNSRPPKRQRFG